MPHQATKQKKGKHYQSQNKRNKQKTKHNHKSKSNKNKKRSQPKWKEQDEISPNTLKDPRFKKVFTDPRFQSLPQKQSGSSKIGVDSRFASMFSDPAFHTGYRIDRYGRQITTNDSYDVNQLYELQEGEGYEAEQEVDEEDKETAKTSETVQLSKKMQKQIDNFKAEQDAEIQPEDEFWNHWDKQKENDTKEFTRKEEKLLNRKAGNMFDYDAATTSSSSESDYNYNTLKEAEVGDDTRGILDDNNDDIECKSTRRLAVVNCDWDNICARDLYMIFRSFLPPEGSIVSVSIHPSDYGVKMMQKEQQCGPDADIWRTNTLPKECKQMEDEAKFIDDNEEHEEIERNDDEDDEDDDDEDEEMDEATQHLHEEMDRLEQLQDTIRAIKQGRAGDVLEDQVDTVYNKQALRKYELQKLRYYYAVTEFDSIETADRLYQEINNREYRQTCNVLSLSFVDDSFVTPHEATDVCTDIPSNYIAASDKQTNALGSTYLELSWDQTDPNRMELCQRAFNEDQLNRMDLEAYLQDDDGITDAGFDTDYPVTEYDTDTVDKKVLIKRRARNRYKEILGEFKEMENRMNDPDDDGEDTEQTDNEWNIHADINEEKDVLTDRLKQKQLKALEQTKYAQLNIDKLSSSSESDNNDNNKNNNDGDKEDTFYIEDEISNLNEWIDTQKRLKESINKVRMDNDLDISTKKRQRNESDSELDDDDDDDEPLVVDNDMNEQEEQDPYFQNVRDDNDDDDEDNYEPPQKKQKLNTNVNENSKKKEMEQRAILEMMMASNDGTIGSYDPENNELDHRELCANLNKRLKRNWRLKWRIKKAVKQKLAERDDFDFDANDTRFSAVLDDPEFAMDPTDTAFRNTKNMKELLKQTRKKRLNKWNWDKKPKHDQNMDNVDHLAVIQSLKQKSAQIPAIKDAQKQRKNITLKLRQKGLSSFQTH